MKEYVTMKELLYSRVARERNLLNVPERDSILDALETVRIRLDVLRRVMGVPLYVTSGYRCRELNSAVGGVRNSLHMKGLAADICVNDRYMQQMWDFLSNEGMRRLFKIVELVNYHSYIHVGFGEI